VRPRHQLWVCVTRLCSCGLQLHKSKSSYLRWDSQAHGTADVCCVDTFEFNQEVLWPGDEIYVFMPVAECISTQGNKTPSCSKSFSCKRLAIGVNCSTWGSGLKRPGNALMDCLHKWRCKHQYCPFMQGRIWKGRRCCYKGGYFETVHCTSASSALHMDRLPDFLAMV